MKVLHVLPSLSLSEGGPSVALPLIVRSLIQRGIDAEVATTNDDGPGRRLDVPLGTPVERSGVQVRYFQKQTQFYKISRPFNRWMREHAEDYDLVHIHALFSYTSVSGARQARRAGVPYVVRPLGVLNRWGMENRRRFLKALSFRWIEAPILRHAAAMHYTSEQERTEAELAGATARAAVLPLGIDVRALGAACEPALFHARFPETMGRRVVLFLSRVDPKKGLDLLLPAFARLRETRGDAVLVLAGDGQADYVSSLRQTAASLGIAEAVVWAGFLGGEEKLSALAAATVFVLPSYSENFGIAAVEALAAGVATVLTPGVAVAPDVERAGAGLVVPGAVEPLAAALGRVLDDEGLRRTLAENARKLAGDKYSLEAMGSSLQALYEQVTAEHGRVAA